MPNEVRSALIGMLVVFKVKAMLPFTILPILKTALIKAVTFPIVLPAKLIGAKVATGAMLANAVLNQTGGLGGGLGGLDLSGLGFGAPAGGFAGFGNKNNSLLELVGQLEALKPNPAAVLGAKFNKSGAGSFGVGAAGSFGSMAADKDLGLLLAAAQLAALQKLNQTGGSSMFGGLPAAGGASYSFGGLSDKEAQVALLISQLAQLQKFNMSGGPALGLSNMRMAAANGLPMGILDKNSSSSFLQLVESLKPNAAAMLASLIGSGSTGGFTGFADKGNISSVVQLLTQLESLKPNPAALLAALTDKNNTLQFIQQLAQMPVFNPTGALAALGLGGFGNKNITLPQMLAQLEALKPNPAALLAGLVGGLGSGEFGGFEGDKNITLPLIVQLALQKPNPLDLLGAFGGLDGVGFGGFGDKNITLPLLAQLALQQPNPLDLLGSFGDKNGTLPLLLQLALQKPNPLDLLGALGGRDGVFGGFGDKNITLHLLAQLALQKPNPLDLLGAFGGFDGGLSLFGDKNITLPLLAQLQKFNVSLPDFPGLSLGSMTVSAAAAAAALMQAAAAALMQAAAAAAAAVVPLVLYMQVCH
jgi:hypothetical protein